MTIADTPKTRHSHRRRSSTKYKRDDTVVSATRHLQKKPFQKFDQNEYPRQQSSDLIINVPRLRMFVTSSQSLSDMRNYKIGDIISNYSFLCDACIAKKFLHYVNPARYNDVFEIRPSRYSCLQGQNGLFAKIDIPAQCALGAYRGNFIPSVAAQDYLEKHPKAKDYVLGQIQLRNEKEFVKGYLDPLPLSLDFLSVVNSANFPSQRLETNFRIDHPLAEPGKHFIPRNDINTQFRFVTCGNCDCYVFTSTRAIASGEEIICFYGGKWDSLLERYAMSILQRQAQQSEKRPTTQTTAPSDENKTWCCIS